MYCVSISCSWLCLLLCRAVGLIVPRAGLFVLRKKSIATAVAIPVLQLLFGQRGCVFLAQLQFLARETASLEPRGCSQHIWGSTGSAVGLLARGGTRVPTLPLQTCQKTWQKYLNLVLSPHRGCRGMGRPPESPRMGFTQCRAATGCIPTPSPCTL